MIMHAHIVLSFNAAYFKVNLAMFITMNFNPQLQCCRYLRYQAHIIECVWEGGNLKYFFLNILKSMES